MDSCTSLLTVLLHQVDPLVLLLCHCPLRHCNVFPYKLFHFDNAFPESKLFNAVLGLPFSGLCLKWNVLKLSPSTQPLKCLLRYIDELYCRSNFGKSVGLTLNDVCARMRECLTPTQMIHLSLHSQLLGLLPFHFVLPLQCPTSLVLLLPEAF